MFIETQAFPFVSILEKNWRVIRQEYMNLPEQTFDPWVQKSMHGEGWSVYGMYADGGPITQACEKCPNTAELIKSIPGVSLAGFSRMAPQTHIQPHVGWAASVYRLHLGLVVPDDCRLRVANETRHWQEGKCWIFDDTVDHEAWNDSDAYRGIMLLDFLRPECDSFEMDEVPPEVRKYAAKLR